MRNGPPIPLAASPGRRPRADDVRGAAPSSGGLSCPSSLSRLDRCVRVPNRLPRRFVESKGAGSALTTGKLGVQQSSRQMSGAGLGPVPRKRQCPKYAGTPKAFVLCLESFRQGVLPKRPSESSVRAKIWSSRKAQWLPRRELRTNPKKAPKHLGKTTRGMHTRLVIMPPLGPDRIRSRR